MGVGNPVNIILAGYGHLGSALLGFLGNYFNIDITAVVEPNLSRRHMIPKGIRRYETIDRVPKPRLTATDVVVDCSPKGIGRQNKNLYQNYGLPAIFQSGENSRIGTLWDSDRVLEDEPPSQNIRIPCCSTFSPVRVVRALKSANLPLPTAITSFNVKTMGDGNITMDYQSGSEISALTGIPTRTDRVHLPGIPNQGNYLYVAKSQLIYEGEPPSKRQVLKALGKKSGISVFDKNYNLQTQPRTTNTLAIADSINSDDALGLLSIVLFSHTPEIAFPCILGAIKSHAR